MAKRETNIFSVAFLDLLSGALAAVIILFIIVPKMDATSKEAVETLQELELEASELQALLEQLENSVDAQLFNAIQRQMDRLEASLQEAQSAAQQQQQRIESLEQQNAQLQQSQASLEQQLREAREEIAELKEAASESAGGGSLFGVDAELAIVYSWEENADIDLYLRNKTTGEWCWFQKQETDFARLLQDVRQATGSGYEMIYQETLTPGSYDLYINLFEFNDASLQTATASGYIVLYPGTPNERKVELGAKTLRFRGAEAREPGNGEFVRSFTVSPDGRIQ